MERIIPFKRSVVFAADVSTLDELKDLAGAMAGIRGIGGSKVGFTLGLQDLLTVTQIIKDYLGTNFPVIYDHQKAGNDIPDMGKGFAKVLKASGVDAAILFPFAGPATQEAWTKACFDEGLQVLTGGVMTHAEFLESEGGYVADSAVLKIYGLACELGVRHFVVPGTKINWVTAIRRFLVKELEEGNFILYAPGFITQKGDISECGQAAGDEWHAIVGSAIYNQVTREAKRAAAIAVTRQIAAH